MNVIAQVIILAWGWKRRLIALFSGAVGALALPPFDFAPALVIPMTAAVWLVDGSVRHGLNQSMLSREGWGSICSAAEAGWWLGFGYFLAGLWWLGSAFLVEPDKFLWALPLAVAGLPAGLALFTALGFVFAYLLWSPTAGRLLALSAGLGGSEWLRGHALTGFPWNSFGMALGGNVVLGQLASIVGLHGLTFLAIAIFASPATLADEEYNFQGESRARRFLRRPFVWAAAALVLISAYGWIRLVTAVTIFEVGVKLRIMQPNLAQDEKFRPEFKERILSQYLRLSDKATSPQSSGVADATHLIWPESAFPFILSKDAQSLARLSALLGESTVLITGAARIDEGFPSFSQPGQVQPAYFNSIHVIGRGGLILDTYDKVHLVPFGEFLPFARQLAKIGLRQLVQIPGGFESGVLRKLMTAPKLPSFTPLICYEAVFPGEVAPNDNRQERPAFMLNLTNDGWFGMTSGPYQHLAQARLRSIEEGLPLVRAANTGISAIIDPYGRILNQLPLGVEGVLDGNLPKPGDLTFFARHSFLGSFLIFLLFVLGAVTRKVRA